MESGSVRKEKPSDGITENFCMDYVSEMKVPDYIILPDKTFTVRDVWRTDWEKGVQIPIEPDSSKFFHVQDYEPKPKYSRSHSSRSKRDFSLPRVLLSTGPHSESSNTQNKNNSFYDLDVLDHHWLDNLNTEMRFISDQTCAITESLLENAIEFLEATSYYRMNTFVGDDVSGGLGIEYDAETQCAVCQSLDSSQDNEILFCDGCDLAVHQGCYGIIDVPSGRWFCSLCLANLSQDPPKCELCPVIGGGAMKRVKGSATQWCHVVCCLWLPETCFQDPYRMDVVVNVENVSKVRRTLLCCVCRTRNGACVQCSNSSCITSYHVTCAMKNKYEVSADYQNEDDNEVEFLTFCKKHTSENRERINKSVSDDNSSLSSLALDGKRTPRRTRNSHKSREEVELIKTGANFTPRKVRLERISNKFYSFVNTDDLAEHFKAPKYILGAIYEYWKLKRKSMNNQPLLLITDDQCKDYRSSRPVVKSNTLFLTGSYIDLRRDMEKLRNLVHMSYRREKLKKIVYSTDIESFELQLAVNELSIQMKKEQSSEKSDNDLIAEVTHQPKPGIYSRSEYLFYDKFLPRKSTSRRSIVDENQNKINESLQRNEKIIEKDYMPSDADIIQTQRQQYKPNNSSEDSKSLNLRDLVDKLLAASAYTNQTTPKLTDAPASEPLEPKPDIPVTNNVHHPEDVKPRENCGTEKRDNERRKGTRYALNTGVTTEEMKTENPQNREISNISSYADSSNEVVQTSSEISSDVKVSIEASSSNTSESSHVNKRRFFESESDSQEVSKENNTSHQAKVCTDFKTTNFHSNVRTPRVTRSAVSLKVSSGCQPSNVKDASISFGTQNGNAIPPKENSSKESIKVDMKLEKTLGTLENEKIYDELLPVISKEIELKPVLKRAKFAPDVKEKYVNSDLEYAADSKSPLHDVQNSKTTKRNLRSSSKSIDSKNSSSENNDLSFDNQNEKKKASQRSIQNSASSIGQISSNFSPKTTRVCRTRANEKLITSK